jgi:microcystin-dependent protein
MKSKLLLLSFLMLLAAATTFAQTSASASGIAIQGIARDNNNTAITRTLTLKFTIYYGANTPIYDVSQKLVTDAFGVFSTVINPGVANNSLIANNQAFLKIEEGTTIISNEPLNHVPYAIAANNGVPTGSIMPFIGTTAPEGWALCNGSPLPITATVLIAMVGANAPNLGGMFLRGVGGDGPHVGPRVREIQEDVIKSHTPSAVDSGHGHTVTDPQHNHDLTNLVSNSYSGGSTLRRDGATAGYSDGGGFVVKASTGITIGSTSGKANIAASYTGANETRPVNYGVNYIIKL